MSYLILYGCQLASINQSGLLLAWSAKIVKFFTVEISINKLLILADKITTKGTGAETSKLETFCQSVSAKPHPYHNVASWNFLFFAEVPSCLRLYPLRSCLTTSDCTFHTSGWWASPTLLTSTVLFWLYPGNHLWLFAFLVNKIYLIFFNEKNNKKHDFLSWHPLLIRQAEKIFLSKHCNNEVLGFPTCAGVMFTSGSFSLHQK